VPSDDVARFARDIEAIMARIDADPDPERAYRDATEMSRLARVLLDTAAHARGDALWRLLHHDKRLSYSGAGACFGLSKSRISQLLRYARRST
jgi:hypothetical protein